MNELKSLTSATAVPTNPGNGPTSIGCRVFAGTFIAILTLMATMPLRAATNDLTSLLQHGLFEEEANRNLDAAITSYEALAKQFDKDRQIAATAVFRLGECYRKLGQTNQAVLQYERIVREFGDQPTLVTLSRQNLTGMGNHPGVAPRVESSQYQGDLSNEASVLAAKLTGLEQFKKDPERHARAVMSLFPDDSLRKMLARLPDLQAQEGKFKQSSETNLDSYSVATSGVQLEQLELNSAPKTSAWAAAETEQQLRYISERVRVILSEQNLRLEVLQAVASSSPHEKASANSKLPDDEDKEIRRIQAMIQNSPDLINSTTGVGTPLIDAVAQGQFLVVAFLLDHGANINLQASGKTPLIEAAQSGNRAMVELLLNRGADVNATGSTGGTALHTATESGFRSVAEVLVAHHADLNARNSGVNGERTPLHYAASKGRVEMLKLLIAAGADVDARSNNGSTPLNDAVVAGRTECVAALLAAKANVNLPDNRGITPLSEALMSNGRNIVKLLLDAKADPNEGNLNLPLFAAIKQHDTNMVELLLLAGADPNKSAEFDWTFTDAPRRPGESQNFTNTPLQFSLSQPDMVRLLLKFKANPDGTAESGPLLFNALIYPETFGALLEAGADPNVIRTNRNGLGFEGTTPLMTACVVSYQPSAGGRSITKVQGSDLAAARLLVAHGANVNFQTPSDGMTPLHFAARNGSAETVELLLTNRAEVNVRNRGGETPLDLAKREAASPPNASMPFAKIVQLLRQHDARDDLPDFSVIRFNRQGLTQPVTVFRGDTNDWNHFTLLETLLRFYSQIKPGMMGGFGPGSGPQLDPNSLAFPDLTRIIVHRPSRTADGKEEAIRINLLNATNGIDCSKDVLLQFGDVVEIPIREYRLQESPVGLTSDQSRQMTECVKRSVTVKVRDQSRVLLPYPANAFLSQVLQLPDVQSLLLSSSDLSHVRVKRQPSNGGKTMEFVLDVSRDSPSERSLWLRDGDVIEVPEK